MNKTSILIMALAISNSFLWAMDSQDDDRIHLVCVPSTLGGGSAGMATGPEHLCSLAGVPGILDDAAMSERMRQIIAQATILECYNQPDAREWAYARNIASIRKRTRLVQETCLPVLSEECIPVVLGGDCSAALGLLAALQEKSLQLGVASIGGYYNLETPETTSSGNMQGMLLGAASGARHCLWRNQVDADTRAHWDHVRDICGRIERHHMAFAGARSAYRWAGWVYERYYGMVNQPAISLAESADHAARMNAALDTCDRTMLIFDAETALSGSVLPGGLDDVVAQSLISGIIETGKVSGVAFLGYDSEIAPDGMGERVYRMLAHTISQLSVAPEPELDVVD